MANLFNFSFPTFDIDESNEIILDIPLIEVETSKNPDNIFVFASVNEIKEIIVSEMISNVKQDLSRLTSTK